MSVLVAEAVVVGALSLGAIALVFARRAPRSAQLLGAASIAAVVGGAMLWQGGTFARATSAERLSYEIPVVDGASLGGFVTSDSCISCHPGHYDTWHDSYHRTMTQRAEPGAVLGDFDNVSVNNNRGRVYRLFKRDGEYWVELPDPDAEHAMLDRGVHPQTQPPPPRVERRVVMTTGSHNQQTYWVESQRGNMLLNLPLIWLVEDQRWVPREDVFVRPMHWGRQFSTWNDNCIECHAVAGEMNIDPATKHAQSMVAELGITCEACHGPADEHIAYHTNPVNRWKRRLSNEPDPTIVNPQRLDALASAQVCGQCHGMNIFKGPEHREGVRYRAGGDLYETRMVLRANEHNVPAWERDTWTRLEGHIERQGERFLPDRFWPDGQVRVSGREHNAMTQSACYTGDHRSMTCLSCHSMHDYAAPADQIHADVTTDQACISCHEQYSTPDEIAAHTHHPPGSAGSSCVSCHMPYTVTGLMKAIRSHEVDSPSIETTLLTGRPDACSSCHVDRPLEWTAEHLQRWYGHEIPAMDSEHSDRSAVALWALTGHAQQRQLAAYYMGLPEAQQAGGGLWTAPMLIGMLADPYSVVRYNAERSLRTLRGFERFEYDYVGSPEHWRAKQREAMQIWKRLGTPRHPMPNWVYQRPSGELDLAALQDASSRRDNRDMDLRE